MSTVIGVIAPVFVGLAFIALCSQVPEPARQKLNAVMVAGAGAAYLSGGAMGAWEIAFTALVTFCAFKGLRGYPWLGVAWLLHAAWDVVHHLKGAPIIPAFDHSSFGCAICDPVIALWLFRGAPPIQTWLPRRTATPAGSRPAGR